ncbi:hypothetical protein JCM30566_15450 [Marinitoga arctica]
MIQNLFNILKKLDELKQSTPPEIYKKAQSLYKNIEDFSNYGTPPNLSFSAIVPDGSKNFRPIFMIEINSLNKRYICTCHTHKELGICTHTLALIFAIEDYLKSLGNFTEDYHVENGFDEYLGIIDYGESYYLIYPEKAFTTVKIGFKKGNKILLRKDLDSYKNAYQFLRTKIPDDEAPIKNLLTIVNIPRKPGYILTLKSFEELKKINTKKILFKNKREIKWGNDIPLKLFITGDLNEKIGVVELFPYLDKKKIVSSEQDIAYFENNTLSLIKTKTKIKFPYYGNIKSHIKFKDKAGLEAFIKNYLIKYERYGFEIEIDKKLGIKKNLFIPKLNLYINFFDGVFHIKGKFLYNSEIDFYENYKYRNIEEENRLIDSLEKFNIILNEKGRATLDIESFFNFIENDLEKLDKNITIKMNKNIQKHEIKNIHMKININNNWFDVNGEIILKNNKKIDLSNLKNRKNNFIIIKDETFIEIPPKILEKLEDLKIKKDKIEINSYNIYSILNSKDIEINSLDKKTKQFIDNIKEFDKIKEYDIPELKIPMRDYQIKGYYFLRYLHEYKFNGILADDMGLGKTVQTIALILSLKKKNRKFLIITPRSVIYNWAYEIEKFTSNLKYFIYHNNQKDIPEDTDVILTTYGTIRNSVDLFKKMDIYYIILDEAQYIKNNETKLYKSIKKLKASHKLALTGTPLENSLNDLYNIFEFLMPGFFGKREEFNRKFNYSNKESIKRLKEKIYPFILRRKKENVLKELPPKTEEYIFNEMTQHQMKIYHQIMQEYKQKIAMSQGTLNFSILEGLLRLRQVVNHPALLGINIESAKFNEFKKFVLEVLEENHKIVVFSQFVKMINIMEVWLNEEDIKYSKITGQTKKRVEIINEFNNNDNIKILLVSLKAGGTGLNITGADYVIHYDPWWNPAVENQATDRVYRIGQTKPVFVYKFITKNSIEEKIMKLKDTKYDLYNLAISSEKSYLKKLTKDDILKLFE